MDKDWEQAVMRGDGEWMRSILEHATAAEARQGIVNSKDQHGQTGLMVAAMRGHTELVRLLIENGADLDHTAKHRLSALMLAVINRHAEIVRMLVEAGADRGIRGSISKSSAPGFAGLTALELAERADYQEIVALLE